MTNKVLRLAAALVLAWMLADCATLPEVDYAIDPALDLTDPTVRNAQGVIGRKASRSLLASRWKNSYTDTKALALLEEVATSAPLIAGNKVTLLYDGPQTMASMTESIAAATDHINLETYIFDQDAVGIQFADLLIARQRAGVKVHVMYDAVGTIGTPQAFFDRMRDAGIQMLAFNPVNPLKLVGPWEPNQRDHRKLLVVDGRVAFTGGVNISSTYANSSLFRSKSRSDAKIGWRDTHIRLEGPAVAALQWTFLDNWASQNYPDLADSHFFPLLLEAGNKLVRVLSSVPEGDQEIYRSYLVAIHAAKKTIHITSAYFVPDAPILRALGDAVRRGVEVKIVLPGVKESGLVFHAGRSFYSEMLASGIRIFQMQISVLHAKTAVIDQTWSTVGSTNIDMRSFLHNHELNVVVFDEGFGLALESAFEEDMSHSTELTIGKWEQRTLGDRIKEWAARRFEYWL